MEPPPHGPRAGAEGHRVAVIILAPTEAVAAASPFVFSLGAPRSEVVRALTKAAPGLTTGSVAPVIDASEVDGYPANLGAAGLRLAPPVTCDAPTARADEPSLSRFGNGISAPATCGS
jgi:hypothetical protein